MGEGQWRDRVRVEEVLDERKVRGAHEDGGCAGVGKGFGGSGDEGYLEGRRRWRDRVVAGWGGWDRWCGCRGW